jgi:hypothetical protein
MERIPMSRLDEFTRAVMFGDDPRPDDCRRARVVRVDPGRARTEPGRAALRGRGRAVSGPAPRGHPNVTPAELSA